MEPDELEKKMKDLWESPSREIPLKHKEQGWQEFSQAVFPVKRKYSDYWKYAAVAMVVLVTSALGWYTLNHFQELNVSEQQFVVIENPSHLSKIIYLPDSTRIELSPESQLAYASNFKENRSLTLSGEAFFKVTKDPKHPFSVQCNDSKTTVLGTSFTVKSLPDSGVNVQLFEGKVQMELEHQEKRWQLAPGEQFLFQSNQVSIDTFYMDQDFNQVPLSKIVKFLEEKRGYLVETNSVLANRVVTLRIGKRDDMKDIATLIATLYEQRFEIDETTHTIRFFNKK